MRLLRRRAPGVLPGSPVRGPAWRDSGAALSAFARSAQVARRAARQGGLCFAPRLGVLPNPGAKHGTRQRQIRRTARAAASPAAKLRKLQAEVLSTESTYVQVGSPTSHSLTSVLLSTIDLERVLLHFVCLAQGLSALVLRFARPLRQVVHRAQYLDPFKRCTTSRTQY